MTGLLKIRLIHFDKLNDRVSEDDVVTLGSIVSGIVDRVTSNAVVVSINSSGFSRGTISMEHLADHHGKTSLMFD